MYLASSTSVFRETDRALDLMGNGVKAAGKQRFICFSLNHSFPHLAHAPSPSSLAVAEKIPNFTNFSKVPKDFHTQPSISEKFLEKKPPNQTTPALGKFSPCTSDFSGPFLLSLFATQPTSSLTQHFPLNAATFMLQQVTSTHKFSPCFSAKAHFKLSKNFSQF